MPTDEEIRLEIGTLMIAALSSMHAEIDRIVGEAGIYKDEDQHADQAAGPGCSDEWED